MQKLTLLLFAMHLCAIQLFASSLLPGEQSCDTIYVRDGRVLVAHVVHISPKGVKYWLCNTPNDDLSYFLPLSEVREIKWDSAARRDVYQVQVKEYGRSRPRQGFLLATTDSTVVLVRDLKRADFDSRIVIPVKNIKTLRFRKLHSKGRSILAGAFAGAGASVIWGFSQGDDPERGFLYFSKEQKILMHAIFLVPAGLVIGAIIGSFKKKIRINGDLEKYRRLRPLITFYTLARG